MIVPIKWQLAAYPDSHEDYLLVCEIKFLPSFHTPAHLIDNVLTHIEAWQTCIIKLFTKPN